MKSEFSKLGISDEITKAMDDMGWKEPTPIQTDAIPQGLKGRDLLAQAQTGTGKTGTFGAIILSRIDSGNQWAKALILSPTRELALQTSEELDKLSKYTGHRNATVYGGVSMLRQTQALDRGVDIIVATPGRLCDHLKDDERLLDDISVVVLDEADRMLDMGFKKDLEFILERIPSEDIQTMLFSATMDPDVRKLAMRHLNNPKEICVSKDEIVLDLVEQKYVHVEKDDKIDILRYYLAKEPMKTIVFCFTKYRVDKVVRKLKMSFKLAGIHGEYSQNRREETLRKFKNGEIDVLVASDIAARGLDIEKVERIINFDTPPTAEIYVHRIGRTGRAGNTGVALSFVMKEDKGILKEIERLTGIPLEWRKTPSEKEMEDVFREIRELPKPVMIKRNSRKNDVPVKDKVFVIAEINIGKADGVGKADIAKMIRDSTDVPKKSIGNIFINEKTTTIEIEKKYAKAVDDGFGRCNVGGKSVKIWKLSEIEKEMTAEEPTKEEKTKRKDDNSGDGGDRRKSIRGKEERPKRNRSRGGEKSYRPHSDSGNRRGDSDSKRPYKKRENGGKGYGRSENDRGRRRSDVENRKRYDGPRRDGRPRKSPNDRYKKKPDQKRR